MLIVILVVVVFFAVVAVSIGRGLQRQRRLPAVAATLGFTFDAAIQKITLWPEQTLPFVPIMGFAPVGWVSNLMRGVAPQGPLTICDYQTTEMDNPRQTLFCLDVSGRALPSVAIAPVGSQMSLRIARHADQLATQGPDAFAEAMGAAMTTAAATHRSFDTAPVVPYDDLPGFSGRFEVRACDAMAARQLLTPAMIDYFARSRGAQLHLVTTDRWLIVYQRRKLLPTSAYAPAIARLGPVFSSISALRTAR